MLWCRPASEQLCCVLSGAGCEKGRRDRFAFVLLLLLYFTFTLCFHNVYYLFSFKLFHGSVILFGGVMTALYLYHRRLLGGSTHADYRLVTD